MKLLLLSDTHGSRDDLFRIISAEADSDLILHLGDGANDLRTIDRRGIGFIAVRGNCDPYGCPDPEEMHFSLEGLRFFITHGHRYQAKSSDSLLYSRAAQLNCDICCYGHTHHAEMHKRGDITLINPGSVGRNIPPCYAILIIRDGLLLSSELKTLPSNR